MMNKNKTNKNHTFLHCVRAVVILIFTLEALITIIQKCTFYYKRQQEVTKSNYYPN